MVDLYRDSREFLLKEIECNEHNIQQMVNALKYAESKGEYRTICAIIKDTVKTTRNSKYLMDEYFYDNPIKNTPRLFEVQASPIDHQEHFQSMDSFFGGLD